MTKAENRAAARAYQQQKLRFPGQSVDPLHEGFLDAAGKRTHVGKSEPACDFRWLQAVRQLQ